MNAASEDVKDRLVAGGLGVFASQTDGTFGIFIGHEPTTPDTTITIYDTGAPFPGYYLDRAHPPTDFSTFQIRVRDQQYLDSHKKIKDVDDFLSQIASFNVPGVDVGELNVRYSSILKTSGPLFLEKDNNDRFIWVANFQVFREETGF